MSAMKISTILAPLRKALNGNAVSVLEQVITELESERDAAIAGLAQLDDRRQTALLTGDEKALAQIRQERGPLEDRRDAAVVALGQIRAQLGEARDAARQKRWGVLQAEILAATAEYVMKTEPLLRAFQRLCETRTKAEQEGFGRQLAALPMVPNLNGNPLVATDLLGEVRGIIGNRKAKATQPVAAPAPVRPPAPKPRATDSQHAVRLNETPAVPPRARRPLRTDAPSTDAGMVLIQYEKSNIELPSGELSLRGDRVQVPEQVARSLTANGGATLVQAAKTEDTAKC